MILKNLGAPGALAFLAATIPDCPNRGIHISLGVSNEKLYDYQR
jgi:hypothetical protein